MEQNKHEFTISLSEFLRYFRKRRAGMGMGLTGRAGIPSIPALKGREQETMIMIWILNSQKTLLVLEIYSENGEISHVRIQVFCTKRWLLKYGFSF